MAIITISRQNGSLGDEIAEALASRLGTTVISREFALENFFGEINPGTLNRLNESAKFFDTKLPDSERTYSDILVEKIRTLASGAGDKDIVILGMGGSVLLAGFPGAIHIRITASEATRVNTLVHRYHITVSEANDVLEIGDRKHRKFVRTLYGKDITDPGQFDLILNTDRLCVDECVDSIIELARKHEVPPYVVFQDASLEAMTTLYPITLEEMQNIPGVGVGKAKRYGQEFCDLIKQYCEENEIERPTDMRVRTVANKSKMKVNIIHAIDHKIDLEEIAKSNGIGFDELLDELEAIVYSGTKLNIDYFLDEEIDEDCISEIYDYFRSSETDNLDVAVKNIEGDYDDEVIRLVRIKFISELAN